MLTTILTFSFLLASTRATPISRRAIDLDNNGVPDYCVQNQDGTTQCLENGVWTPVSNQAPSPAPTQVTPVANAPVVLPRGQLPAPDQFDKDNGTKWTLEYVGDIQYEGKFAANNVTGDKCRTSKLGGKIIWNCGDMMCDDNVNACGFSMGAAMYGSNSVMKIDTGNINSFADIDFVQPWSGDAPIQPPFQSWGMDTSNIAPINDTHGVAYAWEIWRNSPGTSYSDRGNAVASVTLGDSKPIANRVGPLLTGPESIQLGLVAIMRDQDQIYIYSEGGPSGLTVTRVTASDDVFDASKYEALQYGSTNWGRGIPNKSDNTFGMTTEDPSGKFGCAVYGSVFYNNYLNKYMIICSTFQSFVNMYTSDTPYGPWSGEYQLLTGWTGYGSMAHPDYSPGGSHKELYFSQGPNTAFNMFKLVLNY